MKPKLNGNEVVISGKSVMLNAGQMGIFSELLSKHPRVVSDVVLMTLPGSVKRHTLTQNVSQLRKRLAVFSGIEIVTHSKVGYALKLNKGE